MGPLISSWDISWSSPITRRKCCSGYESEDRYVSPQFHLVFDENFVTFPHLRAENFPGNWADLVTN